MRTLLLFGILLVISGPSWSCFTDSDCAAEQLCECAPRDARGICQSAGVCVARHPDEQERDNAPFFPEIEEELASTTLSGDVAEQNPRNFVRIVSQGKCGPAVYGGRFLAIENQHPDQRIYVTYTIRFLYQGRTQIETKTGRWSAGRTNPIGCTVPGPTEQRFHFSITGARF